MNETHKLDDFHAHGSTLILYNQIFLKY